MSEAPLSPQKRMFSEPEPEQKFPVRAGAIAAVAIAILVAVLVALNHRHGPAIDPGSPQPPAAYAANLKFSDVEVSQSEGLSGVKSTFVDGHITNNGPATVTGISVQATFAGEAGTLPQLQVTPLLRVRLRSPEVDTEMLHDAPLAQGATADFRLIFEGVQAGWNEQAPELRVIGVSTK